MESTRRKWTEGDKHHRSIDVATLATCPNAGNPESTLKRKLNGGRDQRPPSYFMPHVRGAQGVRHGLIVGPDG